MQRESCLGLFKALRAVRAVSETPVDPWVLQPVCDIVGTQAAINSGFIPLLPQLLNEKTRVSVSLKALSLLLSDFIQTLIILKESFLIIFILRVGGCIVCGVQE